MSHRTWIRIALGYVAFIALQVGLWAQFAPRSFYDDYPGLGRTWVSVDGPYNEHLVRDVGGLYLALAVLVIAAAVTLGRTLVMVAAGAALMTAVPHTLYHLFNNELSTSNAILSIGGLALSAVIPAVLLVFAPRWLGDSGPTQPAA